MTTWRIEPGYKYDLANLCNLFTEDPVYTERHRDVYDAFRARFDPAVTAPVKAMLAQGVLIGPALCYALSTVDYDGPDIDRLAAVLSRQELLAEFPDMAPLVPAIEAALRHANALLPWERWDAEMRPEIDRKCEAFRAEAADYPVIELVREMVGPDQTITSDTISLYLSKLAAPHGIGLTGSAFVADLRWDLRDQVVIATHEMLHPPFGRDDIGRLADAVGSDDLLQEAKDRLPPTSGYASMAAFVEENIVEGAHIYLAEKMGLGDDALGYFIRHDHASHVLSVLIYDALKRGLRDQVGSLRELVWLMLERGEIAPGAMRQRYVGIYQAAGRTEDCPYRLA